MISSAYNREIIMDYEREARLDDQRRSGLVADHLPRCGECDEPTHWKRLAGGVCGRCRRDMRLDREER